MENFEIWGSSPACCFMLLPEMISMSITGLSRSQCFLGSAIWIAAVQIVGRISPCHNMKWSVWSSFMILLVDWLESWSSWVMIQIFIFQCSTYTQIKMGATPLIFYMTAINAMLSLRSVSPANFHVFHFRKQAVSFMLQKLVGCQESEVSYPCRIHTRRISDRDLHKSAHDSVQVSGQEPVKEDPMDLITEMRLRSRSGYLWAGAIFLKRLILWETRSERSSCSSVETYYTKGSRLCILTIQSKP